MTAVEVENWPCGSDGSGYNVWHRRLLEAVDCKAVQSAGVCFSD
jgi:hypothetical protein